MVSVSWTKNGQELTAKNGVRISFEHNLARLEIRDVKVKDAGRYQCNARNAVGGASCKADLVVKSMELWMNVDCR